VNCDADDARTYLAHLLQGKVAVADEPAALRLLVERSQSLFLYLSFVRSRLAEVDQPRVATLEELRHFPHGLTGIYEGEFKRVFKSKSTQAWLGVQPLLARRGARAAAGAGGGGSAGAGPARRRAGGPVRRRVVALPRARGALRAVPQDGD
jgi:hypothetical protein